MDSAWTFLIISKLGNRDTIRLYKRKAISTNNNVDCSFSAYSTAFNIAKSSAVKLEQ